MKKAFYIEWLWMKTHPTITIALVFIYYSCVSEFQPRFIGSDSDILVANSFIFADSVPVVSLMRSKNKLGDDWHPEKNASVKIEKISPNNSSDLQTFDLLLVDSVYKSLIPLEAGFEYRLKVRSKDGIILSASTYIPFPVKVDSIVRSQGPVMSFDGHTGSTNLDRIFFHPKAEAVNYFETKFYRRDVLSNPDEWGIAVEDNYSIYKSYNRDEIILSENLPDQFLFAFPFSVNGNAGSQIQLTFYRGSMVFILETTSAEYYHYKKSLYAHLDAISYQAFTSTSDLYNPSIFKTPLPLFSNIEGGRGIFAGLSRDFYIIERYWYEED
ncbi:DUF4249 family protein [Indibacter alkaliphilus]|nr:DUF4249 family protein [Indibacter alkaliphilus]